MNKKKIILLIVMVVCLALICICGWKVYSLYREYKADRDVYDEISSNFAKPRDPQVVTIEVTPKPDRDPNDPFVDDPMIDDWDEDSRWVTGVTTPVEVDFEYTQQELSDEVVAWIHCEDTKINYPVMHHSDNDFYLNHNSYGQSSACGAIFLSAQNFGDFRDRNSIIHGHHINDGSMFGGLHNWKSQSYFDKHRIFYLMTPNGDYEIEMFAYLVTPSDSDAFRIDFTGDEDIEAWVAWLKEQSSVTSDYSYQHNDKFVVLSTCEYEFASSRGILVGVLTPIV